MTYENEATVSASVRGGARYCLLRSWASFGLAWRDAPGYAQGRACFRSGEIKILDSRGAVERVISFSEAERKL
jgi:hypothetical protein